MIALCASGTFGLPTISSAQESSDAFQRDEPVLMKAEELSQDEELGITIARGAVELVQGERILFADALSYNERQDTVTATGNIKLLEPTGEVIFAEYMELTGDLREGAVRQIRILLDDNISRLAASSGRRVNGNVTELSKAIYSPCATCKEDPTKAPLWQIKADRVIHDQKRRKVEYRHARLEVVGVPILYTPYLQHPDPTVERETGFLSPSYGNSSELGTYVRTPYFFALDSDKDLTLDPIWNEETIGIFSGQYRQKFNRGFLEIAGSLTRADRTVGEVVGAQEIRKDETRGHIFSKGRFEIDDSWRWGFDLNRSTDQTYLRRFNFWTTPENSDDDYLTSDIYAEAFRERNYVNLTTYSFQDLRTDTNLQEQAPPDIVALADYNGLGGGDNLGGRWSLDLNSRYLSQDDAADSQRFAVTAGYELPLVSPVGLVTTVKADVHGDVYFIDQKSDRNARGEDSSDNFAARFLPSASIETRYPFIRDSSFGQQVIEPIVKFRASPDSGYSSDISNDDSTLVEEDVVNIFSEDRLPGTDRLDSGTRITYGGRFTQYGFGDTQIQVFLGQNYTFNENNDLNADTGLRQGKSDFVGRTDLHLSKYLDIIHNFALDEDDLDINRNELNLSFGTDNHRISSEYTFLDDTINGDIGDTNELTLYLHSRWNQYWRSHIGTIRDLDDATGGSSTREAVASVTYEDECCIFSGSFTRKFTSTADVPKSDDIFFQVTFKTLGDFRF